MVSWRSCRSYNAMPVRVQKLLWQLQAGHALQKHPEARSQGNHLPDAKLHPGTVTLPCAFQCSLVQGTSASAVCLTASSIIPTQSRAHATGVTLDCHSTMRSLIFWHVVLSTRRMSDLCCSTWAGAIMVRWSGFDQKLFLTSARKLQEHQISCASVHWGPSRGGEGRH